MDPVVDDVAEITPDWMSEVLQSAGVAATVASVSSEPIGVGQMAATHRLALTYDGEPGPASLVVKLGAGDEAARQLIAPGYRVEVGFYTVLAGALDVDVPRCWHGAISDDATTFTLVLDDLAPRQPGDLVVGCTVDQAADAVRNLARLHASSWNGGAIVDAANFLSRRTERGARRYARYFAGAVEEFIGRYGDAGLGADDAATLRTVVEHAEAWELARMDPYTLVHADYRPENLMFPVEGDGVVALDWQSLVVGHPARDLSYFVALSLAPDARRAHEWFLVGEYHRQLVARGVEGYDLEQCRDDYRYGHFQGPLTTVMGCVYSTGVRDDASDRMFLTMVARSCAAIRDLDTVGTIG